MKDRRDDGDRSRNPLRIVIWSLAAFALLMPLIAMRFTSEVDWDAADFVVFGAMLLVVCGGYELATRMTGNGAYRLAAGIALLGAFLLTWMNLAVGIIGSENNPANLIYSVMLLGTAIGAFIVRFGPRGLARVMFATAVAQGLIAVIVLVVGWGYTFVLTGFFVFVWLASAQLFRKAEEELSAPQDE